MLENKEQDQSVIKHHDRARELEEEAKELKNSGGDPNEVKKLEKEADVQREVAEAILKGE